MKILLEYIEMEATSRQMTFRMASAKYYDKHRDEIKMKKNIKVLMKYHSIDEETAAEVYRINRTLKSKPMNIIQLKAEKANLLKCY
jgi:beta-N-acetylglucosaminidase